MIEGAKAAPMPGFIKPQLATLKPKAPTGERWVHEIKFDGYRVQVHVENKRVTVFTRNGLDWTHRFHPVATHFALPIERGIFDGEVVVIHEGRTNFSELQADLAAGRHDRMSLYLFDLPYFEGFDLRESPLLERKRVLNELFDEARIKPPLFYSEHFEMSGAEMLAHACKLNWEGIISKRIDAPYRSERTGSWLKVKCAQRAKFPVIGFIEEPGGVAALYLGHREGKDLRYIGKVGTGFTRKTSGEVRRKLEPLVTPKAMLSKPIRKPKATWVKPQYFADVEYRDITSEGLLRHSSFKGLTRSE